MKHTYIILSVLFGMLSIVKTTAADLSSEGITPVIKEIEGNIFTEIVKVPEAGDRGHALYLKGNNLYCGSGSMVQVYDVSDPLKPRLRSQCKIYGSVRQLVADDRAIYATARGGGLSIIDAADLDNLKYAVRYDAIELATGIDVAGDVLFVTLRGYGVEFVDVRDIYNPQHIYCQKTAESQSCWYQDGYLYSGEWGKGLVTTIKASDMSDIRILSEDNLYGHGDGLSTLGNRLYASTGHTAKHTKMSNKEAHGMGHGLDIFDISDPSKPVFISRCQFDRLYKRGAGDWWTVRPSADGKTVFVAAPVVGKGMSWINLNGTPKNSKLDTSVEPSAAACPYRNGTVLVNIGAYLTLLKPGVVPAKIISQKQGNFKGSLVWDGNETFAINSRHGKEFKKASIPSVEDAQIVWREILEGNPDRAIFWDGKILVPAGYQGILIEK